MSSSLDAFGPDNENELAFTRWSVLTPRNNDQRSINEDILRSVSVEELESTSVDGTAYMDTYTIYPEDFLRVLNRLKYTVLKVGALFMVLRTIHSPVRLFKGTHCLLLGASPWVLDVEITTGTNAWQRASLPRCKLSSS